MKRPKLDVKPPYEHEYQAHEKPTYIISHFIPFEGVDDEEKYCNDCDECVSNCICENKKDLNKEVSLQDLIDKIPDGVSPSDIKLIHNWDVGVFALNGIRISFEYSQQMPDRMAEFEKDKTIYQVAWEKYLIEYDKFSKWEQKQIKAKEIKDLEDKLAQLKKKL